MSILNPWGEIKRLRAENTALAAVAQCYSDAHNKLLGENFDLRDQLSRAHLRDPKTGRILPKGK